MSIEPRIVELYAKETHVGTISAISADLFIVRFTSADVVDPNETVCFGKENLDFGVCAAKKRTCAETFFKYFRTFFLATLKPY